MDIEIDERLCMLPDGSDLLGAWIVWGRGWGSSRDQKMPPEESGRGIAMQDLSAGSIPSHRCQRAWKDSFDPLGTYSAA